jgi:hypothetical protein
VDNFGDNRRVTPQNHAIPGSARDCLLLEQLGNLNKINNLARLCPLQA